MSERYELATIADVLPVMRQRGASTVCVRRLTAGWHKISAETMFGYVASLAAVLQRRGIKKGDRVGIIAENRVEWAIADFACLGLGVVDVPVYPTLTAEQTKWVLEDAGVTAVFVSTRSQAAKIASFAGTLSLTLFVCMDEIAGEYGTCDFWSLLKGPVSSEDMEQFERSMQDVGPDDLATIIYTSGTTGTPKGVMLTHGNEASNLSYSCHDFGWGMGWRAVSFLPLSHITARHVDYLFYLYGVELAYCPDINQLFAAFQETKPSVIVGVPRVYEKIRQEALRKAGEGIKRKLFDRALLTGARHAREVLAGRVPRSLDWRIADSLVLHKVRDAFGGCAQHFISGGAPLGKDTALWYASVGIRILEGYGLTETSPVIAVNTVKEYRLGTVGKPLENVECRLAPDGELLVRGPSIFKGYWHSPEETAAAFDEQGWFKTGDIGSIDADGYLSITDRKKDLLKTSGGKFIAPQPIEAKLKINPLVAHAVLIGDRRKFASALLQPNWPLLKDWAKRNGVAYTDRRDLVSKSEVVRLYDGIVAEVNRDLARFETIKKFILIPDELTVESGEITPSFKVRRRVVEAKYAKAIDQVYEEAEKQPHNASLS